MPRPWRRRARRTVLALLLLLATALAGLGAILGTQTGTAWLLAETTQRAGIELSYAALRGHLLGRLELDELAVRSGGTRVQVARAVLHWRPAALFTGRIAVHELRALDITVLTPPAEPAPDEPQLGVPELPGLSLPLPLDIALLELGPLRLGSADAAPVLNTLRLALAADGDTLRIRDLALAHDRLAADAALTLQLRDGWPLEGDFAVSGRSEDTPLQLRVVLGGSVRAPALEFEITAPFSAHGSLRADLRGALPEARVELHWRDAAPAAAAPLQSPQGSLLLSLNARRFEAALDTRLSGAPGGLSRLGVNARGTLDAWQAPFPMQVALDWSAQLEAATLSGRGSAEGDLHALRVEHALEAPFHLTTAGRVAPDGSNTQLELAGQWRDLAWPPGSQDGPASPSGDYRIAGTLRALEASVDAMLRGAGGVEQVALTLSGGASPDAPHPFDTELRWRAHTAALGALSGSGSARGDRNEVEFTHELSGAGSERLHAQGTVTLTPALALDLSGSWRDLRWPLQGTPQASSATGSFAVQGAPGALRTRIEAAVQAAPVGDVALRASALVGERDARELELDAELLGGSVRASGRAGWAPAASVTLDIRAQGIEPARLHPQASGRLDAHASVDVQLTDGKPLGSVSLRSLSGTLGDYPVHGEGLIALTADGFEAREVALGSGENTLTASGRVGESLDLSYRIDAPALRQLWPGLAGAIDGQGTLGGTPSAPIVNATLRGDGLRIGDARVDVLTLQADVNLDSRSQVRASASGVAAGGISIDDAKLTLDGTRAAHRLTLAAGTSEGRLALAARGALGDATWSGKMDTLSLDDTALGDWKLAAPVAITADRGGAESGEACLRSEQARLCVDAERARSGEQSLSLALSDLAMARFAQWLPPEVAISGSIDASGHAARSADQAWTAKATLSATPTRIAMAAADPPLELSIQELQVEAAHDARGSRASLRGRLGEAGSVRGEIRLEPADGAATPLRGELQASLPELAPFAALLPALRDLAGRLDADLTLAGSTASPALRGEVTLSEAGATIPAAGITVERSTLRLAGDADGGFSVDGTVHSGPGAITLRGEGRITDDGYRARVTASGDRFEAMKTLEVQALVSPELELDASPQRIAVTGRVHVPEASIDIQELPPNVVQISADEVIRGREPEPASAWRERLQVQVDVSLGDAVHVLAFGLDSRLSGGLALAVRGAATPTARGTVTLVDGRFSAYGQALQIRRGRLLFAGPLDNPGLDFRAVRDAGEVVAGIEVSGSADRMRSRLFSEPSLPQAEALAWLLTGRGLASASSDDGSALASAAVALGLERSEMVTREIGTALGLDELSVSPGGSLDQSALVLGKALTPRLYIRYALGLLDGQGSVQVDYKITERISVEAESGERQGADVIYRLER